jgi:hypothetical protein
VSPAADPCDEAAMLEDPWLRPSLMESHRVALAPDADLICELGQAKGTSAQPAEVGRFLKIPSGMVRAGFM